MTHLPTRILSSEHETSEVSLISFFVFFGLLAGIITREIHKKTSIPYTPVLLVLGLLVSLIGENVPIIGQATSLVAHIDPAGILLIFIPILIFESSFKADWHIFKRSMKQILLLAGPGLAISFAMTAVALKVILRYDDDEFSWSAALMLGAIVAATDPVAIVALLKSLGAPFYFSTLVEGESLFNDGTGVVFFTVFANIASGKEMNVGIGIGFFFYLCIGGIVLGFIFSLIASFWLEKIFNDSILSITITITASYLLFWVSETFTASFNSDVKAGVSGILALCTLGLFLSAYGKTKISNHVEHPLHAVIGWAQYVSETLIFLLTGIIVGKFLFHPEQTIGVMDWVRLILFFILLNLIRAALVAMLSPILKRGKYKMTFKELFILSYAGLRGALGLSLALSVHHDEESLPRRTRELVLFYVAGTAALTLLVNGTTTGYIVRKIKMIKEFPIKKKMFQNFLDEITNVSYESYEKLRSDNPAAICDWDSVKRILGIKDDNLTQTINFKETKKKSPEVEKEHENELRTEARYKMLHIFKQLVWERHAKGELEAFGANTLDKAVHVSLDDLQGKVNIFEFLYMYFLNPGSLRFFLKFLRVPLIGRYFKNLVINQMLFIYDVTTSLVNITEELKSQLTTIPLPEKYVKEIFAEFEKDQNDAVSYLNRLEGQFLDIITYITTKRYITKILLAQKKFITERYNISAIEVNEYNELTSKIDKTIRNLPSQLKIKWEAPTFSSLLLSFPMFNMLTEEQIKKIVTNSKKIKFKQGQFLFQEGEPFDGIYLITQGEVKVSYESYKSSQRGVGRLVSFFNLVMYDDTSRISCIATQKGEAQKINLDVMREVMRENKQFEEKVYKGALGYLRFMRPDKAKELVNLTDIQVKSVARSGEIVQFSKGTSFRLSCGGFVLKGCLKRWENIYNEYCMIPKHSKLLVAETDGMLIKFHTTEFGLKKAMTLSLKTAKKLEHHKDLEEVLLEENGVEMMEVTKRKKGSSEKKIMKKKKSTGAIEIDLTKED